MKGAILMKIVSIEPTPSPNAMKINLDESLPPRVHKTYTKENKHMAPEPIRRILEEIPAVKSVFHTADFLSLERVPSGDWREILAKTREIFGEDAHVGPVSESVDHFGEVKVYVQMFRKIPMQIRVRTELEEVRESLPQRFVDAAMEAGMASPNLIRERKLVEWGIRYGEPKQIAEQVLQELEAAYDDERLQALKERAMRLGEGEEPIEPPSAATPEEVLAALDDPDWRKRYAALAQWKPEPDALNVLEKALQDENVSVRRLAVVYLGDIGGDQVLPLLFRALEDASPAVRRTAGDTLSDLGDPRAIPPMIKALKDENKLVRWRAARFLYEVGDETAVEALKEAVNDPEFEVSLQAGLALERIEKGEKAEGTIWQQMTRARQS